MFRPNSAIFRLEYSVRGKNYLSDLNAGVQGRGRDLVYKYGVSGWNGVGTSVCPLGEFICWSVGPRGWFLRHGGPVSEVVVLRWPLYVGCFTAEIIFSSDTVFQLEDGRIRRKQVVGKLLYWQIYLCFWLPLLIINTLLYDIYHCWVYSE